MSDSSQFSPCPCQKLQLTDHAKDHAGPAGFSSQLGNCRHMTPTAKPIPATFTSRSITCPATDKEDTGQCIHACQHNTLQPDGCGQVDKQGALQINCRCSETEPPPCIPSMHARQSQGPHTSKLRLPGPAMTHCMQQASTTDGQPSFKDSGR
jgi:hypothetical protein